MKNKAVRLKILCIYTCNKVCSYKSLSYLVQSSSIPEPGYVWQLSKHTFGLISAAECMCVCVCWSSRCLLTPDSVCFSSRQKWHLILRICLYRGKSKAAECIKCDCIFLLYFTHPVLSQSHNVPLSALTFLTLSPFLLPFLFIWVSHTHTHTLPCHFSPLSHQAGNTSKL